MNGRDAINPFVRSCLCHSPVVVTWRCLRQLRLAAGLSVAICVAGCARPEPERLPVARVTGVVTYQGQPVPGADVVFVPDVQEENGGRCYGTTDDTGHYQLTTYQPHDGALVGSHRVTVVARQRAADGAVSKATAKDGTFAAVVSDAIPARYADLAQSELTAEVNEGENIINLELKN